jgi:hypothetical protein
MLKVSRKQLKGELAAAAFSGFSLPPAAHYPQKENSLWCASFPSNDLSFNVIAHHFVPRLGIHLRN